MAVAPYGVNSASTRVRVEEWLRREAPAARRSYYAGTVDVRPHTLARIPGTVLRAELALRRRPVHHEDVLLLHREASPFGRGHVELSLIRSARRSVFDIDDALFTDSGTGLRRLLKHPEKYTAVAKNVDAVVTGNPIVADWASQHCRQVVVVPTCIDPADYDQKTAYEVGDRPVIGWIGTFSGIPQVAEFADAFREVRRRTGAVLEIVGENRPLPAELAEVAIVVPWSLAAARERLATWDVGIMPLVDDEYNRGKSAYKLLQYAAAGLPAIASPVGMNAGVLDELGAPGPTTNDEWVDALTASLTAPTAERVRAGDRARQVAAAYSYSTWSRIWRDAVLGAGPAKDGPTHVTTEGRR